MQDIYHFSWRIHHDLVCKLDSHFTINWIMIFKGVTFLLHVNCNALLIADSLQNIWKDLFPIIFKWRIRYNIWKNQIELFKNKLLDREGRLPIGWNMKEIIWTVKIINRLNWFTWNKTWARSKSKTYVGWLDWADEKQWIGWVLNQIGSNRFPFWFDGSFKKTAPSPNFIRGNGYDISGWQWCVYASGEWQATMRQRWWWQ